MFFFKKFCYLFIFFLQLFICCNAWTQDSNIKIFSIDFNDNKKILITLNKPTEYKIFTLSNPNRVSIEILNAKIDEIKSLKKPDFVKEITFNINKQKLVINLFFHNIYTAKNISFDAKNKIISCDLVFKESGIDKLINESIINNEIDEIAPEKLTEKLTEKSTQNQQNIFLQKNSSQQNLLDKDLKKPTKLENFINENPEIIVKKTPNSLVKYKIRSPNSSTNKLEIVKPQILNSSPAKINKKPVSVIDAGHGGKDPGTIGVYARSKEKNITLSYAKELAKQLAKENKYKVYLTRDSDIFIPLDKRVAKSRRKKADLFISLHANSISDNNVSGFSIYTLSENSSDKQAELLAQKENQADIINGIDFSGASREITKTLIDLSQRESKNNSARLAKFIIRKIKSTDIEILQNTHRFAGFMVLTAPDMAAVLIELGYLSNKHEEKLLNSLSYRRLVSKSLTSAINKYFENYNL
jgi:N-acetylmuramoyl-L-alanine amidase